MNKTFINLLWALSINFSMYPSEFVLKYDQHNRTGLTLEQRAKEIKDLLEGNAVGEVWILHTKYTLNPADSDFGTRVEEIRKFLASVVAYDQLSELQRHKKRMKDLTQPLGIQNGQSQQPRHVDPNYSKVWSE